MPHLSVAVVGPPLCTAGKPATVDVVTGHLRDRGTVQHVRLFPLGCHVLFAGADAGMHPMNSTNDKKINPETAAHKPSPRLRLPNRELTAAPPPAMPTTTSGPHEGGEGGEGGGQPRSAVTNEQFLLTLFPALDEGAKVLALAKPGNPHTGGWVGFDAVDAGRRCGFNTNNFFIREL